MTRASEFSHIPIIDVSDLVAGRPSQLAVAGHLGAACRESGFFYVVGHGVEETLLRRLRELSREFFAQDLETKLEIRMARGGRAWRGYFRVGDELTSGKPDQNDQVIASGGKGQHLYTESRWKPCLVDRVLEDGEEVKLGGVKLVARRTPGHTRGCTTWSWKVEDAGQTYDVVVIGSPNVNPGYRLVGNREYAEIADDFARTFEVLKSLPCDVFLGAHGVHYGMVEKHGRTTTDPAKNPFVDPEGYRVYVAQKEKVFRDTLAEQRKVKN